MKKTLIIIASVIVLSVAITFVVNLLSVDDENLTETTTVVDTNTIETTTAVTLQNRNDVATTTTFNYFTTTTLNVIDEIRERDYQSFWTPGEPIGSLTGFAEYPVGLGDELTNLSAGRYHTCGIGFSIEYEGRQPSLPSDKSVYCWGSNGSKQLGRLGGIVGTVEPDKFNDNIAGVVIKKVSAGNLSTCVITTVSTEVQCWGDNNQYQLGTTEYPNNKASTHTPNVIEGFVNVQNIFTSGGNYRGEHDRYVSTACAIDRVSENSINADIGNIVKCWGRNEGGMLGSSASELYGRYAGPLTIKGSEGAVDLSIGGGHICAIIFDYTVRCWGVNNNGQIGQPLNIQNSNVPLEVNGISGAIDIASGNRHTCVIAIQDNIDRGVWCWGANNFGQLANSHTSLANSFTPIRIGNITGAKSISGNTHSICIRTSSNNVQCWGLNGAEPRERFDTGIVLPEKLFESISVSHPNNIGTTQAIAESTVDNYFYDPNIKASFEYIKVPTVLPVIENIQELPNENEVDEGLQDVQELVVADRRACILNSKLKITCFGYEFPNTNTRRHLNNSRFAVPSP